MVKDLDLMVEDFCIWLLDFGLYYYFLCDVLMMKVWEGGCVVKMSVLLVIGVNNDGYWELLGM